MLLVLLQDEADYACILPHLLQYEADYSANLPLIPLYEADHASILLQILKYDDDSAAILLCETAFAGFLLLIPLYSAATPFIILLCNRFCRRSGGVHCQ